MSKNLNGLKPLVAGVIAASACYSNLALAAGLVLEEIKVTAQLREESLQDVPVSVNAVSGDKLVDFGIDKIEDLQSYVPNLTMSETGIGTNIYIRGIGSGINQGFEQSTGLYVDGVSYGRAQLSRAPFLDLERVEVLRGPQNILFGKNSIAGAVRLITNKPGDVFEGSVSLLYEPEHGEQVADLVLSGPLTSSLGARLAYRNRQMDGYIENLTTGEDEPERDEETLRLIFVANPSDDLELALKLETAQFDVNGRQMEITNEQTIPVLGIGYSTVLSTGFGLFPAQGSSVANNVQDFKRTSGGDTSDNSVDNVTLSMDYAMGDHTLSMTAAHMQYDYEEDCDCDFTGADIFRLLSEEDYEQSSLELRITSPTGNAIEYIAGFYYQESDLDFADSFSILPTSILTYLVDPALGGITSSREFQQDSKMAALFGQATWSLSDTMRLNFGLRYSEEKKEATRALDLGTIYGVPVPSSQKAITLPPTLGYLEAAVFGFEVHSISGDRTDEDVAPQISFEWDATNEMMVYASAAKGSKSGGFDVRSNADPRTSYTVGPLTVPTGAFEFEDESATSLELGAKSLFFGGSAELNAALFFTDYSDLQISIYDGKVGFNVGNAAEAETYGLELDGRWLLSESLTLYGSLAFIDFEFTDFSDAQCYSGETPTSGNLCSRDGATNQYVADWSGNVGLDYRIPVGAGLELRSGADVIFTDAYNPSQSLDPRLDQSGYAKLNARVAIADIDNVWEVALIGKNLTDEEIMTYGAPAPLAYSSFGLASYYTFWERPRSVALQGTYRF